MTDPVVQPPPEVAPPPTEPPRRRPEDVPWSIADSALVYVLWWVVLFGLTLALRPLLEVVFPGTDLQPYTLPVTLFLLLAVTLLYVRRFGAEARKLFGARPRLSAAGLAIVAGALAAALGIALGQGIEALVEALNGRLPPVQEEFQQMAADESLSWLLVISSVIFAPIAEETFFRGMLFPALSKRLGVWPGIGLSAVAFSITHIQTTLSGMLLVLLLLMPLAMLLAWLYHRLGTLLAPILAHATFNLINVFLLMAQVQQ